jgi:hypothetical protein
MPQHEPQVRNDGAFDGILARIEFDLRDADDPGAAVRRRLDEASRAVPGRWQVGFDRVWLRHPDLWRPIEILRLSAPPQARHELRCSPTVVTCTEARL